MGCEMEGCERPLNRDGLCFPHKAKTVNMGIEFLKMDNRNKGVDGGMGTAEYVKQMYENRRAAGMHDPEAANEKAAIYAPKPPLIGRKAYRKANNGL